MTEEDFQKAKDLNFRIKNLKSHFESVSRKITPPFSGLQVVVKNNFGGEELELEPILPLLEHYLIGIDAMITITQEEFDSI